MVYYIIDLSIRGNTDELNSLTFLSEEEFEESLNFNLDEAIKSQELTEKEAEGIIDLFNHADNIEYEVNGFKYGKGISEEEIVEAYKDLYTFEV